MSLTETQSLPAPLHTKARLPADSASKRLVLSRKLKDALREIVWNGKDIAEAARSTGYKPYSLRVALAKPHVRRFLKEERDVFIAQAQGQNIFRAIRNADSENAAASQRAVEFIERLGEEQRTSGAAPAVPGVVIVIGNPQQSQAKLINADGSELQISASGINDPLTPHKG